MEARRFAVPALGIDESFELDDFTQQRLLQGLDDVGITLTHDADIAVLRTAPPRLDAVGTRFLIRRRVRPSR